MRTLNVDFDVSLIDWLLNSSLCCFEKVLAWLCREFCPGLAVNLHNKAPWKGQGYQRLAEDVLPLTQLKEDLIRTEIINSLNFFSWGSYLADDK